jgi:hypothetical protein
MFDKEKLKRQALLVPCRDKKALQNWLKTYLDVDLFDTIVSRDATSSPLDAAWELYDFCMTPKDKTPQQFLYASSRATQKTLLLSAVETVLALHSRRSMVHFAAAREQVKPAKKYMVEFSQRAYIKDLLKSDPTSTNIIYLIPEFSNKLWLEGKTGAEIL